MDLPVAGRNRGGSAEPPLLDSGIRVLQLHLLRSRVPSDRIPTIEHVFVDNPGTEPALSLDALERKIGELAAEISAATCRWLGLVAEFERRSGHERQGFVSCTSWLAWRCGLTPRAAREQMRVARALDGLPSIRAAFASGRISYSKARALTRAATPEVEAELLEIAEFASASQLEEVVRGFGRATTADDEAWIQEQRHVRFDWREDGSLRFSGVLTAEEGALLSEAIDVAREVLREDADSGEESPPDRADGLIALAEGGLAGRLEACPGGDRHQIVVHAELDSLVGQHGSAATIGRGGSISDRTLKRLGCDASVVTIVERDGVPLSVGRKTRTVPPSIARALRARDGGCRFPGCGHTRYVDAHHIEHWAEGGETSLGNLVQLCRRHHRLIHQGGFSVEADGKVFRFRRGDGRALPVVPRSAATGELAARPAGPAGSPSSGDPRLPLDLDLAVAELARRAEHRALPGHEPRHRRRSSDRLL